jgi:L-threonylcarbamoyladenylate synthase
VKALSEAGDLTQAAANLLAALRRLDALGLDLLVAQSVPEKGMGAASMDRLQKASTPPQRGIQGHG